MANSRKLDRDDFSLPCEDMARNLLGKLLVRKLTDGRLIKTRIVEVECYLSSDDEAGRRTLVRKPDLNPGTALVFMTFGLYYGLNISATEPGASVLLRAVEPVQGIDIIRSLRTVRHTIKNKKSPLKLKDTELCNGPSRLCMALDITTNKCDQLDLVNNDCLWMEEGDLEELQIVPCTRIRVSTASKEWAKKPLRFYILGNRHVSKRDRVAEKALDDE